MQGNFDPAPLFALREPLERRVRTIVEEGRAAPGHIVNLATACCPTPTPTCSPASSSSCTRSPRGEQHPAPAGPRCASGFRPPTPHRWSTFADAGLYEFIGGSPPSRADLEARYARQGGRSARCRVRLAHVDHPLVDGDEPVGYVQATVNGDDSVAELA